MDQNILFFEVFKIPLKKNNLIFTSHILKWFAKTKRPTDLELLPVFVYTKEDA